MSSKVYDDVDVLVAKCLSNYTFGPDVNLSEGRLDPVPPDLPGRVDLSDRQLHPEYPATSPIGVAQRVLFDENPTKFLNPDRKPPVFRSSSNVHRRHVAEMLASKLCHKKARKERECGFARFFTVLKKIDDDGIAVLRTILDCVTANESFINPYPVNLSNLHTVLSTFAEVECLRTLDLRHWFHQLKAGKFLQSMMTVAFGSLRLLWDTLAMGFKWAPFISQAVTTMAVVGQDEASTWTELPHVIEIGNVKIFVIYDNVLAGGPEVELDAFWEGFLQRLDDLNILVKPGSDVKAVRGTHLDALGLKWLPRGKDGLRWCLLP
ncbi:MAG: hypothetical protein FJ308_24380, partial [Planctomycetes bacterium]|nr:hypothetical protein [Planctomycetota bacterium]